MQEQTFSVIITNDKFFLMENVFNKLCNTVKNNVIFELKIPEKNTDKVRNNYDHLDKKIGKFISERIPFRKARFISIELIENVLRYGYFNNRHSNYVAIAYKDNQLLLSSSNLVKNDEIYYIDNRLREINASFSETDPHKALRLMYRNKLARVGVSENDVKIGILELARRLDDKIYYRFEKVDDEYSIFTIICVINV